VLSYGSITEGEVDGDQLLEAAAGTDGLGHALGAGDIVVDLCPVDGEVGTVVVVEGRVVVWLDRVHKLWRDRDLGDDVGLRAVHEQLVLAGAVVAEDGKADLAERVIGLGARVAVNIKRQ